VALALCRQIDGFPATWACTTADDPHRLAADRTGADRAGDNAGPGRGPMDKEALETAELVKIDLLGLRMLSVIDELYVSLARFGPAARFSPSDL